MLLVRKFIRTALAIGALTILASCGGGSAAAGGGGGGSSSSSSGGGPSGNVTSRISIDGTRAGQTISGWEVTARFWEFDKANDRYDSSWLASRDAIVQKLVDDAGINRVRLELRSGVENPVDYWSQFVAGQIGYNASRDHYYEKINDNSDPAVANPAGFQWSSLDYYVENFVLPMKASLAARNKTLFLNLCVVDFNWTPLMGDFKISQSANEYAELVTMAAMRLRDKYGISPSAIEIILEPDNGDGWTGPAIGRAIVAAKARLAAAGINPKFIGPSASAAGSTANFLDGIGTVAGANSALNTVPTIAMMALQPIRLWRRFARRLQRWVLTRLCSNIPKPPSRISSRIWLLEERVLGKPMRPLLQQTHRLSPRTVRYCGEVLLEQLP
jgi:hypothetical protein